jgi:hypothetical protein
LFHLLRSSSSHHRHLGPLWLSVVEVRELSFCSSATSHAKGAHTRTSLASESCWARVPMSQTRPCVECHELDFGRLYCIYTCISELISCSNFIRYSGLSRNPETGSRVKLP